MNKNESKKTKVIVTTSIVLAIVGTCFLLIYARTSDGNLTEAEARNIAYTDANITSSQVVNETIKHDPDDKAYVINIIANDGKDSYEYEINTVTGIIMDKEHISYSSPALDKEIIDKAKALSIALKDAGVDERDLDSVKNEFDMDDKEYDIEFTVINLADNTKYVYEYEIDGELGNIIHHEKEKHFL